MHPDYIKKDGIRDPNNGMNPGVEIHRLFGATYLDKKIYRVKTTIKYYSNNKLNAKTHTYEVTKIELLDVSKSSERDMDSQAVSHIQTTNLLN